jgi:signal transduction histidine kinase
VVTVLAHTFGLDQIGIRRDYGRDVQPLRGDREKIKQVFVNLLSNARDAIGREGTITIVTRCDRETGKIRIILADTGSGIAPENMDRIFDPFYTTKPVDKGTGLGLSVSFGIIKEHGGTIEVESPPSAGTRQAAGVDAVGAAFIIQFPPDNTPETGKEAQSLTA